MEMKLTRCGVFHAILHRDRWRSPLGNGVQSFALHVANVAKAVISACDDFEKPGQNALQAALRWGVPVHGPRPRRG